MTVRVNKISRVVELNDEEETKITEFLAALDSKYVPAPPLLQLLRHRSKTGVPTRESQERMYAYAFLLSRDWNMKKALQMADEAIKFREKEHLDQFNMFPSAFAVRGWPTGDVAEDVCASRPPRPVGRIDRVCAGIDQHFSASLHSWDKEGLPVLYLMVGRVDEAGLLGELKKMANVGQTPTDVMFEYVQHAVSVGEVLAMHQQKLLEEGSLPELRSEDGVLRTVTIVVDAEGLNYKMLWKPALDLFMGSLDRMFRFFPDCVNRIMVVNCPSMVMFAYGIVKVVLNEAVQRKVSFYKPKDTAEALRQVIDEERLPSFLGGTCRCADHCVGSFDPDCPNQRAATTASGDEQDGDVATQDIVLKAGKKHFEVFELDKGEQVVWEFVSEQGHGVTFRVFFVPSHEPNVSMDKPNEEKLTPFLTRHETPSEGMDTFTAKEAGSLVLLWDNKKSWFTAKKLQMKVFKCPVATLPPGASPVSASSPTMESPHHHESEVMPAETI